MKSKISFLFAATIFFAGLYAAAGGPACKDNFTTCTENGCGVMIVALNCELTCSFLNGQFTIDCKSPGQLEEDSKPTTGAP